MRFAIDKGHNLSVNRGATGIEQEDDLTAELGERVIKKLQLLGHETIDCTPATAEDINDALQQRAEKANKQGATVFVSIHFNAFNSEVAGTEIYFFPTSKAGKKIAECVLKELVSLGFRDRGVKPSTSFYVLKKTRMPAILIETCFCDCEADMTRYRNLGVDRVADAIVKGLVRGSEILTP